MKKFNTEKRVSKRRHAKISGKSMTDQSQKKQCNINNIVATYHKTGQLPQGDLVPQYGDISEVPTLEQTFDVAQRAVEVFNALPATVRRLIDNNPLKLESWVSDEDNYEIAVKHGLINKKIEPKVDLPEVKKTEETSA